MAVRVPYLLGLSVWPERIPEDATTYPFNVPFVAGPDLTFTEPVVFFVGENGTGKSTLIEAIAELCRFPVSGGSRNELADNHGPERESSLSRALRRSFRRQPRDGYFLRAEFQAHFASLLDARKLDPDFKGDPYGRYGGKSLHARSHGEAFLAVLQNRIGQGLFLLDEPESALSPTAATRFAGPDARFGGDGKVPVPDCDPLSHPDDVPGRANRKLRRGSLANNYSRRDIALSDHEGDS